MRLVFSGAITMATQSTYKQPIDCLTAVGTQKPQPLNQDKLIQTNLKGSNG